MTSRQDSTTLVDQFIQQHQHTQEQQQQERERRLQAAIDKAIQDADSMLKEAGFADLPTGQAGLMEALRPCVQADGWQAQTHRGSLTYLVMQVDLCDELQLAGFYVVYNVSRKTLTFSHYECKDRPHPPSFWIARTRPERGPAEPRRIDQRAAADKLGRFLEDRRQQYAMDKKRRQEIEDNTRKQRLHDIRSELHNHGETDADKAEALLYELQRLGEIDDAPQHLTQWQERHAEWQKEQELQERHAKQVDAYIDALQTWDAKCDTIRAQNQRALEELQQQWDTPRTAWKVFYGIVAHDSDDTWVDENYVISIEEPPKLGKRGITVTTLACAGKTQQQWIYNPTRHVKITTKPTERVVYQIVQFEGFTFYLDIDAHPEALLARAQQAVQAIPPAPEPGELLDEDDVKRAKDRAFHHKRYW